VKDKAKMVLLLGRQLVDWIYLAHDNALWFALVKLVINFWGPQKAEKILKYLSDHKSRATRS
jgi:hypothetical protein